jgi:hypothetical protein
MNLYWTTERYISKDNSILAYFHANSAAQGPLMESEH